VKGERKRRGKEAGGEERRGEGEKGEEEEKRREGEGRERPSAFAPLPPENFLAIRHCVV